MTRWALNLERDCDGMGTSALESDGSMYKRVSGGCVSRVELSAGIRQGYPAAPCVPPETEADPVQRLFCQLNLAFDGLLVMFRL